MQGRLGWIHILDGSSASIAFDRCILASCLSLPYFESSADSLHCPGCRRDTTQFLLVQMDRRCRARVLGSVRWHS